MLDMVISAPVVSLNLTSSTLRRCQDADVIRWSWYSSMRDNPDFAHFWKNTLTMHLGTCPRCLRRVRAYAELARVAVMPEMEGECQASEPITTSAQL